MAEDADGKAARLKAEGNAAFRAEDNATAVRLYSEGLEHGAQHTNLQAHQHVLMSNRSQAFVRMGNFDAALRDAVQCTLLAPKWHKGWARRGNACVQLGRDEKAFQAYSKALELEPHNKQYQQQLAQLELDLAIDSIQNKSMHMRAKNKSGSRIYENKAGLYLSKHACIFCGCGWPMPAVVRVA